MKAEVLEVLLDNFVKFVAKMSGIKLYPYQIVFAKKILESIFDNDGQEIVSLWARQSGKTETVAMVCYYLAICAPMLSKRFTNGIKIGIFAPKLGQSWITFGRLKDRFDSAELKRDGFEVVISNGNTFTLNNGSMVKALSSQGTIEGETFDVIIVEEAQDVDSIIVIKSILPMGAATNATRVFIGTASYHKCYFWQLCEKYQGRDNLLLIGYKEASDLNKNYKEYVDKEKSRIGEYSDAFRSQYNLEWILERGNFITLKQLEDCVEGETYEIIESKLQV